MVKPWGDGKHDIDTAVSHSADSDGREVLVGGLEHFLLSHILGIIIPIDFHIFERGSNHQPALYLMIFVG